MLIIAESIFWTSLGIFLLRGKFITLKTPKLLGRLLYWIGIPLQILALARRSNFEGSALLPPSTAIIVLLVGMAVALICSLTFFNNFEARWQDRRLLDYDAEPGRKRVDRQSRPITPWEESSSQVSTTLTVEQKLLSSQSRLSQPPWRKSPLAIAPLSSEIDDLENERQTKASRASKASFVLASMLGNTGFIGLAIAPTLVSPTYWSWIVIYGVVHNVLGSYGLGVVVANYYSRSQKQCQWLKQLRHILMIPSLWAFILGWLSRDLLLPEVLESGIQTARLFVLPGAFLLIGMQLGMIQKIDNWQRILLSSAIKISILPLLTGLGLTLMGTSGDGRLALVLMSGTPTAFANVILAEEYDLNRELAASSVLLSTVAFPLILPLWLILFK